MKTQNQLRSEVNLRFFMILPAIALFTFGFSSCGKNKTTLAKSESIFVEVDSMPVFPGGDIEILNFVKNNTLYPEEAKRNNLTGKVIVRFVVEKDCTVSGVEILQKVDPVLDAEAVRVVASLPKFNRPAKKDGKTVRVYYMLPITFALQ